MDRRSIERVIAHTHLKSGVHHDLKAGACAMELVSCMAGEPWSDHPACVCPTLGAFVRRWNDDLRDDERDAILKPFLRRLISTRGSNALAERRALMAFDWLVRIHMPEWLRLAKLNDHADTLASLPEITSAAQLTSLRGPLEAARKDAAAAWDAARAAARAAAWAAAWDAARAAAWAAAGAAAWDAAWDAARAAARAAARDAAWAAAWDAARAAARDAAWAAAWAAEASAGDALKQTRLRLQGSACDLLSRMIDAKEAA